MKSNRKEKRKEKLQELLVDAPLVKPSVVETFNTMFDYMTDQGLTTKDIIYLVQRRTRPRVKISDIESTFQAVRELEKQILRRKNDE